jgi:hypothetical protein
MELSPAHTQFLNVLIRQKAEDEVAAVKKKQMEQITEVCRLAAAEQAREMQKQIEELQLKCAVMEATQEKLLELMKALQEVVKAQGGVFKKKKRLRHEDSDEAEEEVQDKGQKRRRGRPKKADKK